MEYTRIDGAKLASRVARRLVVVKVHLPPTSNRKLPYGSQVRYQITGSFLHCFSCVDHNMVSGRLPNADMGTVGGTIQHIRDIFGRMGFSDREIVALLGAHAVGRCHTNASGNYNLELI